MKKELFIIFILCLFVGIHGFSQGSSNPAEKLKPDSLYKALRNCNVDSLKAKISFNIGSYYFKENLHDSCLSYFKKSLAIAVKIDFKHIAILSCREIGACYTEIGLLDSAIVYYNSGVSMIYTNNPKYVEIYGGLGNVYYFKGDYIKAYEAFLKYLRMAEELGEPKMLSRAYTNVGVALKEQKKFDDALVFFNKSLDIAEQHDFKKSKYVAHTNIGNIYWEKYNKQKSDYLIKEALSHYLNAREIVMQMLNKEADKSNAVTLLNNIGNIYADLKQYDKALEEYGKAMAIMNELEFFGTKSIIYNNLASIHIELQHKKEAEKYLLLGHQAAVESESPDDFLENYKNYSRFYELTNDYKKAYLYQLRFKALNDSLFSTETAEKRKEIELNAEFVKREAQAKAELDKKELIAQEEKKKQQIILYAFIGGFVLMLLVAFLIFRGYREKQKANDIITQQKKEVEKQKELVEEKQKEIVDSIRYAKRIQQSLMPTDKYIEKRMENLKKTD